MNPFLLFHVFLWRVLIISFPWTQWNSEWWILFVSQGHRKRWCKYRKYLGISVSFNVEMTFIIHFLQNPVQATVKEKMAGIDPKRNSTKERHSNISIFLWLFINLSPLWPWFHHSRSLRSAEHSFESCSLITWVFIFIACLTKPWAQI